MDFLGFFLVLGIIIMMLGVLSVLTFFWENKWKILLAVGAFIAYKMFKEKEEQKGKSTNIKKENFVDMFKTDDTP
jgi:uncharacterized membrane protein